MLTPSTVGDQTYVCTFAECLDLLVEAANHRCRTLRRKAARARIVVVSSNGTVSRIDDFPRTLVSFADYLASCDPFQNGDHATWPAWYVSRQLAYILGAES